MLERKSGLVVEIVEQDTIGYHGQFYFDLFEVSLKRLAYSLGHELAPYGVTAVAITPRTGEGIRIRGLGDAVLRRSRGRGARGRPEPHAQVGRDL
jgi:hypothetical protein